MKNPRPEDKNTNKDVRNIFRLEKLKEEKIDTPIKDIRNLFRLEKVNESIKDIILRDIRDIFENEEENNYYKPISVGNFWSNNYIEYESNGDRNKTSVEE